MLRTPQKNDEDPMGRLEDWQNDAYGGWKSRKREAYKD